MQQQDHMYRNSNLTTHMTNRHAIGSQHNQRIKMVKLHVTSHVTSQVAIHLLYCLLSFHPWQDAKWMLRFLIQENGWSLDLQSSTWQ